VSLAEHRPWVERLARWVGYRYASPAVEHADLVQEGLIALHGCAQTFDASHGATLRTYAGQRVVGAMVDELRRADPAWRAHRGGAEPVHFTSLEDAVDLQDQAHTPADLAELRDDCRALRRLVRELPAREREVIVSLFDCDEELKAMGGRLGVSDSYVCQLKQQALARLRLRFNALQRTMA